MDQGGVCLGFFLLSSKKSRQTETNGVLSKLAFPKPKPKQSTGRYGEARFEVLPAASSYQPNRFLDLPISFTVFTVDCHC
jgi:hypothetical protein